VLTGQALEHHQRGIPFAMPIGRRDGRLHDQPGPMLHQHVTQVAQVLFAPARFLVEPRIRIGGRLMRVVGFLTGPRLQQRAVDGEMIVRQQALAVGMQPHGLKEPLTDCQAVLTFSATCYTAIHLCRP
jgi:hypothetical protein